MVDKKYNKENKNTQCIQCQKNSIRLEEKFCSDDCKNQWLLNNNDNNKKDNSNDDSKKERKKERERESKICSNCSKNPVSGDSNQCFCCETLSNLKSWEVKAKEYLKGIIARDEESNWTIRYERKVCKKCVTGDPPDDYPVSPPEKYHISNSNNLGDEITYIHVCSKDDNKNWPPNWLNNCVLCEKQYKEAQEKVQTELNRYELKDKKECFCYHRPNRTSCSIFECFVNHQKKVYINENGTEIDQQGRKHDEICRGATGCGASIILVRDEFYKVKLGQVCEICQETINSLEDWEVKGKETITDACSQEKHYKVGGSYITKSGGGDWKVTSFEKLPCCGRKTEKNSFGDAKPCPRCSINNPPNKQISQAFLPNLIQLQQFIVFNNIHSIINQNGNLVIIFNTNTNTNTTPPSQTITDEELTSETSTLNNEQKTMWQKFKDYLKKKGKNKMDKQELEQEIKKLENDNQQSQKPTSKAPWIIGGITVGIILLSGIVLIIRNNKRKNKKL